MVKKTSPKAKKKAVVKKATVKTVKSVKNAEVVKPKLQNIRKRDGSLVPFDVEKIENAVSKAMRASGEGDDIVAKKVAESVGRELEWVCGKYPDKCTPTVEEIQDVVEKQLILHELVATSKAYILYRERRAEVRREKGEVPQYVKDLATESKKYFRNALGEMVYYRTYARWIEEEGRRETWIETVDRYMDFMRENLGNKLKEAEYNELREAILKQQIMPSMRLMQFAGKAARNTNVCAYNCSYIAPKNFQDFGEIMYISMCGTGVGWSAEAHNVEQLPRIKQQSGRMKPAHVIDDSKEGWCDALVLGMNTWANGEDISFDYSKLRPAGARLATMGGKSSGPEPLRRLLDFTRQKMVSRQNGRLSTLDVHDIICTIGDIVVSGGVRRSAMISLSDLHDQEIRDAKSGQFYLTQPQRMLANNSAVYNNRPSNEEFLDEWLSLIKSGSGERGIFNRGSIVANLPKRRVDLFNEIGVPDWGTNPCGEIILQSKQFCNLSEVIARAEDTKETLLEKARLAAILGTYQSTLTNFPYLSKEWKENCEQERLLGVSITGQWDSHVVRDPEVLAAMKAESVKVNKVFAKRFGVNASSCVTCVKPSGTVSQTFDCASGMHPRHAKYYIRRIRISATDALFKMLVDQGVPYHPEIGQSRDTATTYVLEFPIKAPKGAIVKNDISAIDQLEHWKMVKKNFTEHNPSVTVSVGDDEWIKVGHWVYENWDTVGGLSFLPRSNHVYQLAPYEEIDEARYNEVLKSMPEIDFSKILIYERDDETEVRKELACAGGSCEVEIIPTEESAKTK